MAFPEDAPKSGQTSTSSSVSPPAGALDEQAVILPAGSLSSCPEPAVACVLDGATPGSSDLTGFFDRFGFGPG